MAKDKDINDDLRNRNIIDLKEARRKIEEAEKDAKEKEEEKIDVMNREHTYIESIGGKPYVTCLALSEVTEKDEIEYWPLDTFKAKYANDLIQSRKSDRMTGAGQWWLEHEGRKSKKGIIFNPSRKDIPGYLNLWRGFAIEPKKGSWKYTKRHIWLILANKNKEKFNYIIKWLAWMIQNPGTHAEVALIFTGKKGTGKSFLFVQFLQIFGQHGMGITDKSRLTGQFGGHFRLLSFLFGDEVYEPKDKEVEGRVKAMITQPFLDVEAKFQNPVTTKNRLHIVMCTNNEHVALTSKDERRYFINKVDDKYTYNSGRVTKKERIIYFNKLWGEMDNGGRAAMLYDLKHYKLDSWHPRFDIPETEELEKQKMLSMSPLEHTILLFLQNGEVPGRLLDTGIARMNASELYDHLEKLEPYISRFSTIKKANIIRDLGAMRNRMGPGIFWDLPPLKEMRENWNKAYGIYKWDGLEKWNIIKTAY